jgi:hypothetical protein
VKSLADEKGSQERPIRNPGTQEGTEEEVK